MYRQSWSGLSTRRWKKIVSFVASPRRKCEPTSSAYGEIRIRAAFRRLEALQVNLRRRLPESGM
jgi:hypothetical protein